MRVLVACKFSGVVRDAFTAAGHYAVSCDLLPSDSPGRHFQGDVGSLLNDQWDLMIAHPPCTFLTVAANKWMKPEYAERFPNRARDRELAVEFFMTLYEAPIKRVAVENPIGIMSSRFRKPDQIAHPWMFGHGETKATCLWLRNLPPLFPTDIVQGREQRLHRLPPSKDRWKLRSTTFAGVAAAMAEQWGTLDDGQSSSPGCGPFTT